MSKDISIEIVIEPLSPYTVEEVQLNINKEIGVIAQEEGVSSSEIEKQISLIPERQLPTPEQLEAIKLIIEITGLIIPTIDLVLKIIDRLKKKYTKVKVLRIKFDGQIVDIPLSNNNIEIAIETIKRFKK